MKEADCLLLDSKVLIVDEDVKRFLDTRTHTHTLGILHTKLIAVSHTPT